MMTLEEMEHVHRHGRFFDDTHWYSAEGVP